MIIVSAGVLTKEGKQEEFIKVAEKCIKETRKENGCISYKLLADTEDACKFVFSEVWDSQESLDLHMKTEHFKELGQGMEGLLAGPLSFESYNGERI